jgi:formylmethanofuran dehydrogenase subunit E
MDNYSNNPESSDEEKSRLTRYTKQEIDFDDSYYKNVMIPCNQKIQEKSGVKNLSKESEEKFDKDNKLKRKRESDNIVACEFCQKQSVKCKKSGISFQSLCEVCYGYEYRHGHLIPLDKRKEPKKHKDHILVCEICQKDSKGYQTGKFSGKSLCKTCYMVEYRQSYRDKIFACEFCQKESTNYKKGKFSGQFLCIACYMFENRHGHLIPVDERKHHKNHKDNILACEFCKKQSIQYKKSKFNDKSLCESCYQYEYNHGDLVPLDERKKKEKHKNNILECEVCQNESSHYKTGKITGKSLCQSCYMVEYRHNHLVLNEQKKYVKHKDHILICEVCQKEVTNYIKGKISGKSLCQSCYNYEYTHGHFLPLDERKKVVKHKNHILVCEACQKEDTNYSAGQISGKSLCRSCYNYEYFHKKSVPPNERRHYGKHKNNILECEECRKESIRYKTGKISGKSLCESCYMIEYRQSYLVDLDERKHYKKYKTKKNNHNLRLIDEEKQ